MRSFPTFIAAAIATVLVSVPVPARTAPVTSEAEACAILTKAVFESGHINSRYKPSDIYCDDFMDNAHYYVFALRGPLNPGGSNLFGWHAVRRSDGAAFQWDAGENVPNKKLITRKKGAAK